jgi:hypothetical protein
MPALIDLPMNEMVMFYDKYNEYNKENAGRKRSEKLIELLKFVVTKLSDELALAIIRKETTCDDFGQRFMLLAMRRQAGLA